MLNQGKVILKLKIKKISLIILSILILALAISSVSATPFVLQDQPNVLTGSSSVTGVQGMSFNINDSVVLYNVTTSSSATANNLLLYNGVVNSVLGCVHPPCSHIANYTITDNTADVNYLLVADKNYTMFTDSGGASYTRTYTCVGSYPYDEGYLTWIAGQGQTSSAYMFDFVYLDLNVSASIPTVTNVEITPDPAYTSDNLTCSFDLNNESTGVYIDWYVNNNITFSETTILNSSILVSSYTTLFDNITCSVTPYNSTYNGTTLNDTITVSGYTLNLTAKNNQTNASISSFYVSISDSDQVISQWNTTTGSVIITQAYTGIKELSVCGNSYTLETYNHTFTINETNLTASLLEVGAIRIKSFDEEGVKLNSTEITITNINGDFSQTNTTTGNELYITTNETGNFSILVTKAGYTNRYYYELMNTGRYILLNAYLSNSTEDITFTVQNEFNNLVNNAQISCYTIINSNLVKVAQKTTDYSGQAVIPLDQTTQYIIRVTSGSYLEKEVTLTPSSTAYTIKLESVGLTYTNIMDSISYEFSPVDKYSLDGNVTYNFITSVSDSSNSLDYWGIYLEYEDGTNYTQNFTDSTGGIAIQNLTTPINDTYINAKFFFHKNGYDTFEKI